MVDKLIIDWCAKLGLSVSDILGHRRTQNLTLPRFYMWNALYEDYGLTDAEIASIFNRERSTVTYGRRSWRNLIECNDRAALRIALA